MTFKGLFFNKFDTSKKFLRKHRSCLKAKLLPACMPAKAICCSLAQSYVPLPVLGSLSAACHAPKDSIIGALCAPFIDAEAAQGPIGQGLVGCLFLFVLITAAITLLTWKLFQSSLKGLSASSWLGQQMAAQGNEDATMALTHSRKRKALPRQAKECLCSQSACPYLVAPKYPAQSRSMELSRKHACKARIAKSLKRKEGLRQSSYKEIS